MKKILLVAAAAAGLATVSPAFAIDGTINVTGQVTASTCKINNAASPATIDVVLPPVSTTSLRALGDTAGTKAFSIALSECGALTKATTYFEQGANTLANGNLRNNAVAPANNVQVRLLNSDQTTAINVAGASGAQNSQQVNIASGVATMNYFAQYYAIGQSTAGDVATSVQFTMQYQ
jgi:major type 1 subunit fimbrin (pilin)